jgi:calcineurin-like phosphoesterase family protein
MPRSDDIPEQPCPDWVISDTHLGHANILRYCPWRQTWADDVEEHNQKIVSAWQELVGPDDWILHLGDFALCDRAGLASFRSQLPGRICLVLGNHDRSKKAMIESGFDLVVRRGRFAFDGREVFARHDPGQVTMEEADGAERILHGHCHGNPRRGIEAELDARMVDCSLDALESLGPVAAKGLVLTS